MSVLISGEHRHAGSGKELSFLAEWHRKASNEIHYELTVHGNGPPIIINGLVFVSADEMPEAAVRQKIANVLDAMPIL